MKKQSVAITGLTAILLAMTGVAPASAAEVTVTTIGALQSAFDNGDDPTLGSNIPASTDVLTIPGDATLDLNGFELETATTTFGSGVTLTVEDSSVGGTGSWTSIATEEGLAGIGTTGATLVVNSGAVIAAGAKFGAGIGGHDEQDAGAFEIHGGTVTATGGEYAAGIGAGNGGNGGTTTVYGGTVTATGGANGAGIGAAASRTGGTTTIHDGVVTAIGGEDSAGIGGGDFGNGGITVIHGGSVTATGADYAAGIGGGYEGDDSGETTITGGTIVATGGESGAGIGGGWFMNGGVISISGGNVTATGGEKAAGIGGGEGYEGNPGSITISGGTVTATGGADATGVGRGDRAPLGGTINLSGGTVTAVGGGTTAVGGSSTFSVGGTLVIPSGAFLEVPSGTIATVTATGVLTGVGAINGLGSIQNDGTITNTDVTDAANGAPGLAITNHNYLIGFDGNYAGAPAIDPVRVYATNFATGVRTLPAPAQSNRGFVGWNTEADGSGTDVTAASVLTGDDTLYAEWIDSLSISPVNAEPSAGDTVAYSVTGFDGVDNLGDATASAVFSTTAPGATVEGNQITFTTAGDYTVTATIGDVSVFTDVRVTGASVASIRIFPEDSVVSVGGNQSFTVEGFDAFSNPLGDYTAEATFTTDVPDATVDGDSITFGSTGSGTVTALVGGVSDSTGVTVEQGTPTSIELQLSDTTVDVGGSVTFTVNGLNENGAVITDLTEDAVIQSDHATDEITGNTVTFPTASPHVITATVGQLSDSATVAVTPTVLGLTGFEPSGFLLAAGLLVLLGVSAVLLRARRTAVDSR